MRKTIAALATLTIVFVSGGAGAQSFDIEGFYAGGAFVFGSAQGDFEEDGIGGGFVLGVRGVAIPWLAFEFQFDYLDFDDMDFTRVGRDGKIESNLINFTVNVRAYPLQAMDIEPLGGRVQPFGLFGFGVGVIDEKRSIEGLGSADDTREDALVRVGGGLDAYLTENISLFGAVTYTIGTGDIDDLEFLNIVAGVQYHF